MSFIAELHTFKFVPRGQRKVHSPPGPMAGLGVIEDVHATWSLSVDMIRCEDARCTARNMPSRRVGVRGKLTRSCAGRSRSFSDFFFASTTGRPNDWIPEFHPNEPAADVHDNYEYNVPDSAGGYDGAHPDIRVRAQYLKRAPLPLHVERIIPAADDDDNYTPRDHDSMSVDNRSARSTGSRKSAGSSRSMISRVSSGRSSDSVRTPRDRQILVRELQAEMEHETMTPSEVREVARTAGLLPNQMDAEDSLQAKIDERRRAKGNVSNRSARMLDAVDQGVTNVSYMRDAKFVAQSTNGGTGAQARPLDNGGSWYDASKPVYKDYKGHIVGSRAVERHIPGYVKPKERNKAGIPRCPGSNGF